MKRIRAALPLALCMAGVVVATASQVPDLPKVTVTDLPAEVRDQVREAYDRALRDARAADASGKLGMLLDLYNRPDQAIVCYQRAHDLDPAAFRWLYFLGSLRARRGQPATAVRTLEAAQRLKPDYLPGLLKLAKVSLTPGTSRRAPKPSRAVWRFPAFLTHLRGIFGRGEIPVRRHSLIVERPLTGVAQAAPVVVLGKANFVSDRLI
jgi:tetratricopeptide (TPR) repeat protein